MICHGLFESVSNYMQCTESLFICMLMKSFQLRTTESVQSIFNHTDVQILAQL